MKDTTSTEDEDEEQKLLESLGLLHLINEPSEQQSISGGGGEDTRCNGDGETSLTWNNNKILLGIGGTLFLLPHLAIILSLPPVLQRRGAPYLPTFGNKLDIMFDLIRKHVSSSSSSSMSTPSLLKFVDLGSGDGRVVFRAAREGIFHKSVGYEINPALHMWAKLRQMVTPKYWSSTQFYLGDLWKIRLHNFDVVAVYGLYPIMERLGKKLQQELKPGSIVVSNVFEIPNWKAVSSSASASSHGKGVYLYQVPECYSKSVTNKTKDI
ncbi:hypothetical protein ACHAWC_008286 [Mediolabrus comicus]